MKRLAATAALAFSVAWGTGCATPPRTADAAKAEAAKAEAPAPTQPEAVKPVASTDHRAAFDHAVARARSGDLAGAEQELEALVAKAPQLDAAWTNLGILAERAGRDDTAARHYERALEVQPDQAAAWENLTRLYARTGRLKELEPRMRARIQESPKAFGPRIALVQALIQDKAFDAGATEAKKILKEDERNIRAMQLLARAYLAEGKLELAKLVLENARANDEKDGSTFYLLGLVQLAMKARPQALEAFKQAAALRPDHVDARNDYGALLTETQDYDTAVQELSAAAAMAPALPAVHVNLGNAYRGKGDVPNARAQYEKALALDPKLTDVYFNLGVLHLDGETPDEDAIARFQKAIGYFQEYQAKGGQDERVAQYLKDAQKGIDREQRKRERERKDALRKAEKAAKDNAEAEAKASDPAPANSAAQTVDAPPAEASGKLPAAKPTTPKKKSKPKKK